VLIQPPQGVLDEVIPEGVVRLEVVLAAAHELQEQQVVEQRPGLLDDDFADRPIVVPQLEGLTQDRLGHVDSASSTAGVERLVLAWTVKNQQVRPFDHGDGYIHFQQGRHQVIGQLSNGTVEEFDHVVAGVEAGQPAVRHQNPVAHARLLAEDDRHSAGAQGLVDILMRDRPLAQAAVGTMVTGGDRRAVSPSTGGRRAANAPGLYQADLQWFRSSRSRSHFPSR
jgi:hypothetical protein